MNLEVKLFDSSVKHRRGREELLPEENNEITVLKNEEFGLQFLIASNSHFFASLNKTHDIDWRGLGDRIRIDFDGYEEYFSMNFLGYLKDDNGDIIGDPLLNDKSKYIDGYQMIWIKGKFPNDFPENKIELKLKFYYSKGYSKEEIIKEKSFSIKILDYSLKSPKEGDFYLDLWQHPTSWGRAYNLEFFSDKHFEIIENYLESLSNLGQKVIDLIVSDYPWGGQRCYQFDENPSNLFELNIVDVFKDKKGKIYCDFTALDKYIDISMKHGINEEINIFGILGNWDYELFGSPLENYKEPIRVRYFNEKDNSYDFFRTKEELKEYFSLIFNHLIDRDLWDKVRIMSDQPIDLKVFEETINLLESSVENYSIKIKAAINDQEFFEEYGDKIHSLSLNTCELIANIDKIEGLYKEVKEKDGRMTWYSCCFPDDLNIFLKSPLLESRLKGWFTYYWGLDGFLRWAYGIWTENPLEDIRYKYTKWAAGDMLLIYPGEDLKSISSVREKNFLFGIQDYNLFKEIENKGLNRKDIVEKMEKILGEKKNMEFIGNRNVKLNHSLNIKEYMEFREKLAKEHLL